MTKDMIPVLGIHVNEEGGQSTEENSKISFEPTGSN